MESTGSSERVYARTAELVVVERGEVVIAVAVKGGTADVRDAAVLRGSGRQIWDRTVSPVTTSDAAGVLVKAGARSADAALEAGSFLDALVRHGLLAAEGDAQAAQGATDVEPPVDRAPAPRLGADDLVALMRASLEQGVHVLFSAAGASMRPFVPHGSVIEIAPLPDRPPRRGDILFYRVTAAPDGPARLVAHRLWRRRGEQLVTFGDSATRPDVITRADCLGIVVARHLDSGAASRRIDLTKTWRRLAGLGVGAACRVLVPPVHWLVVRPLRGTFPGPSLTRRVLTVPFAAGGWLLHRVERAAFLLRRRLEVVRAAMMSTAEKDAQRTRFYSRQKIRELTASPDSLEGGLTLLEEIIFHRHDVRSGRLIVLGCGAGRESVALAQRGYRVTALDRDVEMLAEVRRLAERHGVDVETAVGEAVELDLADRRFDVAVAFSGLYNMVLPSARRVAMLAAMHRHLVPGGQVLITFYSAYRRPDGAARPGRATLLSAVNPEHEPGDFFMSNESVHVFPHGEALAAEAAAAGFEIEHLVRDQRRWDRAEGMVRSYAVLRKGDGTADGAKA